MVESIELVWEVLVRLGRGEDGGEVGLVVVVIFEDCEGVDVQGWKTRVGNWETRRDGRQRQIWNHSDFVYQASRDFQIILKLLL